MFGPHTPHTHTHTHTHTLDIGHRGGGTPCQEERRWAKTPRRWRRVPRRGARATHHCRVRPVHSLKHVVLFVSEALFMVLTTLSWPASRDTTGMNLHSIFITLLQKYLHHFSLYPGRYTAWDDDNNLLRAFTMDNSVKKPQFNRGGSERLPERDSAHLDDAFKRASSLSG